MRYVKLTYLLVWVALLASSGGGHAANAALETKAIAHGLKIYLYDLPHWKNWSAWGDITDSDYGLDQVGRPLPSQLPKLPFPQMLKGQP